jgi:hypothetical protein
LTAKIANAVIDGAVTDLALASEQEHDPIQNVSQNLHDVSFLGRFDRRPSVFR